jgi:hypothetical protein
MRTKKEVLLENGWVVVRGFSFPTPNCGDDYDNTFVSEEDALPVLARGVQEYWMPDVEWNEYIYDFDDAWEHFLDDYSCEHDKDFDEEVEK